MHKLSILKIYQNRFVEVANKFQEKKKKKIYIYIYIYLGSIVKEELHRSN